MAFEALGLQNEVEADETFNPEDYSRHISSTEVYAFLSDDCNDTEQDLADQAVALGLPDVGDRSTRIPSMWAVSRRFSISEDNLFHCTVEYSSHPYGDNSSGPNSSQHQQPTDDPDFNIPPWLRPFSWEWGNETKELPMVGTDAGDTPVRNSAGEPYLDLTFPFPIQVLTIKRYEQSLTASFIYNWAQTINNDSFWGYGPGEALLDSVTGQQVVIDNFNTWETTYVFKFLSRGLAPNGNPIGWFIVAPDYGRYDYSGGRFRTSQEVKGTSHWWLNGSGVFAADNLSNASYNYFQPFRDRAFSGLNLNPR